MSSERTKEDMLYLHKAMTALSCVFTMPLALRIILSRDFKSLNSYEAYDILIYLLNASVETKLFKPKQPSDWKKRDKYSMVDNEKLKKAILQAVKDISVRGNCNIPVLKKSDIMTPNNKFLKSCVALSRYAVSFQLSRFEKMLWPSNSRLDLAWVDKHAASFRIEDVKALISAEKKCLEEEKHLFSVQEENLKKELKALEDELGALSKQKKDIQVCLYELIDNCSLSNKNDLKDEKLRSAALEAASKEIDDLAAENGRRLKSLQTFDGRLLFLRNTLENPPERTVIDGKQLATLISYESRTFAEKENIKLFQEGNLNLDGLLQLAVKSFHSHLESNVTLPPDLLKILDTKLPSYEPTLLDDLEELKDKLSEEMAVIRSKLMKTVDKPEMERWMNDFMISTPSIAFDVNVTPQIKRKSTIVDFSKIDFLIQRKKTDITKCTNSSAMLTLSIRPEPRKFGFRRLSKSSLNLNNSISSTNGSSSISSFNLNYMPTKSSSPTAQYQADSPISALKIPSTRMRKACELRRSISSATLRSTPCRATESPSNIEDSPKSKQEESFFEVDKSISPICDGYYNGHSRLFQQQLEQPRGSCASTVSYDNSALSSFILNYSTSEHETRNTFDSSRRSISFPDLSEISLQESP